MKKLFNLRIPFVLACAIIAGVAVGLLLIYYDISLVWIIAVVPVAAVIFVLLTIFSSNKRAAILVLLTALFLIAGTVNSYVRLNTYSENKFINGGVYNVTADVCEKGETANGEYVILKNARFGESSVDGKIIAYLGDTYGEFCDVGYSVSFTATIQKYDLFHYGELNYNATENVKYRCYVYGGLTAEYGFSLFGSIRSAIRNTLYDNVDKDTASIAFAMLTGNTQDVDDGVLESFRFGGIAHIFAVSGLHIGIVYGILYFILRKLKLNKYLVAALCILPVFFYAGICGFTISSIRATIMCTVSSLTRLIQQKYDGLNCLSLSVILILLITPLSLFSVGFQLSVCAVGGIIVLSKNIAKLFKRLPRKAANTLSVSLSAQAATLPVMLANFCYVSGAGLILNIVIIPLLSVIYVFLFICTVLLLILPFASVILIPAATLPLQAVVSFFINTGFEKALLSGFGSTAFIVCYFIILLLLSDKINLKLPYRTAGILCSVFATCAYAIISGFVPLSRFNIIISAYYGGGEVIIKSADGNILIITDGLDTSRTQGFLNEYNAGKLDAVIILGGADCVFTYENSRLDCGEIYVFDSIYLQSYEGINVHCAKSFNLNGVAFEFADGYSLIADCGGVSVGVCAEDYIPFDRCDLLISDSAGNCKSKYNVGFNERSMEYNVYDCGDFNFKIQ